MEMFIVFALLGAAMVIADRVKTDEEKKAMKKA